MRWRRLWACLLGALVFGSCGSVIYTTLPPTEESRYDIRHPPPCIPEPVDDTKSRVRLRYLGAGGLYVEWRGEAVLFSPFFSNPGILRVPFGERNPKEERIDSGLANLNLDRVGSIIVGHAHYDHLGDLPEVAEKIPRAKIYTNANGVNFLSPWQDTVGDVVDLSEVVNRWRPLKDRSEKPLPFRIYPIESSHAHHLGPICWRCNRPNKPWPKGKKAALLNEMWSGNDLSFVLDLLDRSGEETLFRIFYQDAASNTGMPEVLVQDSPIPVDLAMLCMASSSETPGHPEDLVSSLKPRHLMFTHYEDFFRSLERPLRFVPLLTNKKADDFVRGAERALVDQEIELTQPLNRVCGPASSGWSMPLPGKELIFEARKEAIQE